MRAFVPCSLGLLCFTLTLSGQVFAQSAEEPEEIIVRGKTMGQFRLEIEQAHDEMIQLFNEANEGNDNDVRCRYEAPTGSRIPKRVCFSAAQDRAGATGAQDFLTALFASAGKGSGGPQANAQEAIRAAQVGAAGADKTALDRFEDEWRRVMGTNRQFYDAVVKYSEMQSDYDEARGATIRIPIPSFTLNGPQCEASTYTEYVQVGNVARVSGIVSISACPAGTTGKFAVVARIRNEAGAVTPIEFSEMWQNHSPQDYVFKADYPIGEDVFLENVRVRNLTCTCESPTP